MGTQAQALRSQFEVDAVTQKVASTDWDSQSIDSSALGSRVARCPECPRPDSRNVQQRVGPDEGAVLC